MNNFESIGDMIEFLQGEMEECEHPILSGGEVTYHYTPEFYGYKKIIALLEYVKDKGIYP